MCLQLMRHVDIPCMSQTSWFLGRAFVIEPDAELACLAHTPHLNVFDILFSIAPNLISLILEFVRLFSDFIHFSNKSFEKVFFVFIDGRSHLFAVDEFIDCLCRVMSLGLLRIRPSLWLDYFHFLFCLLFLRLRSIPKLTCATCCLTFIVLARF